MIQPLRKTVWRFLKKLEIKAPYDPAIPLLGIYPEETKTTMSITSHQSDWPSSKSLQTINAGEGVEKRERSCTVGGNVN